MGFDCTRCGACCRAIGSMPSMRSYDRGDGTCRHLTATNECAIYETRPVLCRVDITRPPVMTEHGWHQLNQEACKRLRLHVYGQE